VPPSESYRPEPRILELGPGFFDPAEPARFPELIPRGYRPAGTARLDHPYFERDAPCTLLIDEVESIWAPIAERDDWSVLEKKVDDIRLMGDALAV
jgi:serine/tyrosine/threonine adenylyltransferase